MLLGSILTTVAQYLVGVGIVALGCLPLLEIGPVYTRLTRWPTDRLAVNYLLFAVVVAVGQWALVLIGWQVRSGRRRPTRSSVRGDSSRS